MLLEGPFESDYSLAIVNRRLALAMIRAGRPVQLHQRDNTTDYAPSPAFMAAHPELAPHFIPAVEQSSERIHSRCIYPPYTDRMIGRVRAVHCYAWEESGFPRTYAQDFNRDLHVITVVSGYVKDVLQQNGVTVPIEVVGNGADHILECEPQPVKCFKRGSFHFTHISSCFPRKGADVLVNAFCREFRRTEDVRLIIKTFANPHNEIERIVAEAFARRPDHAPVAIVWDSFSTAEMRYLIENSDCLVAPSRGEGFGLPVAEAMLLGVPVVATIHGGHADLCSPEWMWPVDFRLAPARTHVSEGESYWAEPDEDSLAARMREVYRCSRDAIAAKTARAKEHVRANFTWERTALRHEQACMSVLRTGTAPARSNRRQIHLGFITTWNARCGIAEYTRYLTQSLAPDCRVSIFANRIAQTVRRDEAYVSRCWSATGDDLPRSGIDELADHITRSGCDAVSVQYNFGLLSPATLQALARRLGERNIPIIATLHGAAGPRLDQLAAALKPVKVVIVHRSEERDKLAAAGLDNVTLQPHGIFIPGELRRAAPAGGLSGIFTVCSFGFFLPPKGIYELLEAFEVAAFVNPALRLKLVNALYDIPESCAYAAECARLIRQRGLGERIIMITEFLEDEAIFEELAQSDLIVLPYLFSTESASGAVRLPLASGTPVLCSDLEIFREFTGVVHFFPAGDVVSLASRMVELSINPALLRRFSEKQREYVAQRSWENVAAEFQSIVESCLQSIAGR